MIKDNIVRFLGGILRCFISLRYKVTVKGGEIFSGNRPKFILPNHQALVDPLISITQIYRFSTVVPVVSEMYYNKPLLRTIFMIIGGVCRSPICPW